MGIQADIHLGGDPRPQITDGIIDDLVHIFRLDHRHAANIAESFGDHFKLGHVLFQFHNYFLVFIPDG